MSLLEVVDVKKLYGADLVFENVSFSVANKDRIGVVGANGSGKTTLMRILSGIEDFDSGIVKVAKGYSVGYLAQDQKYDCGRTLYEELLSACEHIFALRDRMQELEREMSLANNERMDKNLEEYARVAGEFERKSGYAYDYKIKSVLYGLGFIESDLGLIVDNFSGGQKVRVTLAKLLVTNPDLILLDEPTNHLDTKAIEWLEDYLKTSNVSFIVISHDRYFLDSVVDKIYHIEQGHLKEYTGNYSTYLKTYEFERERQMVAYERQQELIAKYEEYIRRYKAGNRSTMAQSREKMLARIERVNMPKESSNIRVNFNKAVKSARKAIMIDGLSKKYGDRALFSDLELVVERGERLGIVGPNGSGKTTFLKILSSEVVCDSGKIFFGENVTTGSFSQNLEGLNNNATVMDEIYRVREFTQVEARNYLARFLFKGDSVFKKVEVLSGGERNRLLLAKLILSSPNLMLLDEPTNHLDIESREALESAISYYDGTVIVASHDRYFLDQVATSILEIANGCSTLYKGNYSFYKEKKAQEDAKRVTQEEKPVPERKGQHASHYVDKETKKLRVRLDIEIKEAEEEIHFLEDRIKELEEQMADSTLYADNEKARLVVEEHKNCQDRLENVYLSWEARTEERLKI